jgi:hypothetical protein
MSEWSTLKNKHGRRLMWQLQVCPLRYGNANSLASLHNALMRHTAEFHTDIILMFKSGRNQKQQSVDFSRL